MSSADSRRLKIAPSYRTDSGWAIAIGISGHFGFRAVKRAPIFRRGHWEPLVRVPDTGST